MAEWYDKAEQREQPEVHTFREGDVRRTIADASRNLARGGRHISEARQMEEADRMRRMSDLQERMQKLTSTGPPMTGGMMRNPDNYYRYKEAMVTGSTSPFQKSGGMRKQGYFGSPSAFGAGAQGGIPSYDDPLHSPTRWGTPTWDENMPEEQKQELQAVARSWSRWYYKNHHVVVNCINIYAQYPFVGLDLQCPDPSIEDEYRQIFFDELNYEDFLPQAALQYWVNGEAGILGEWDPTLKCWTAERIMDSDDIKVIPWPGPDTDKEAYFWVPQESLQNTLNQSDWRDPIFNYYIENFGEEKVMEWMEGIPSELPPDVFSMLRHNQDPKGARGYPILMNAFHILMKEEKLNKAMTAVADRLYTPFMVAKLGSKDLLQGQYPWIPTDADLKSMQAHIEMMMASDYRVMVYHSGIEFDVPFSNQTIPDLNKDLEGTTRDIMGVFGISPDLIYGGSTGTYAAGALSAEIMMQKLAQSQQRWSRWWIYERAKKVAEARGYYQVERKGGQLVKPMERLRVFDNESGSYRYETRRKLQLPAIRMETMDWRDQQQTLQNVMNLKRQFQMPISQQTLAGMADPGLNLDTEREQVAEELRSEEDMRRQLQEEGIQVPQPGQGGPGGGGMPGGLGGPGGPPGGGRGGPPGGGPLGGGMGDEGDMPGDGDRPPQSDEQRADQPTRMTSLDEGKIHLTFTGSRGRGKVSAFEEEMFNSEIENMDEETKQRYLEKAAYFAEAEEEPSYADLHMFQSFRSTGEKKGTLYYLNQNRLLKKRVK